MKTYNENSKEFKKLYEDLSNTRDQNQNFSSNRKKNFYFDLQVTTLGIPPINRIITSVESQNLSTRYATGKFLKEVAKIIFISFNGLEFFFKSQFFYQKNYADK